MKSICIAMLSLTFFVSATSAVPPVINYAGQVAVNGEAFTGNGSFKFAIVNDSGSITYWCNDGTSSAGSEPTASVSVSVNGGLYSVLLGNSAIEGMNAIDPSVFQQHAGAKLRVWFTDGVNGFQQLSPDRPFASVPYALSAGSAGSANIAPGSINGSMLAPSLLADLNSSISDGSISKAKLGPNLVRYFIPEISSNPAAVSIIQGTGTTLAVQATGKFLSYQWQKNGANLAGETNASLILSNVDTSVDDANYSVVISNDWGSVTSPLAKVTVATALPAITLNGPASITHEAATSYTDAGATAVDALGGDLTSSISITSADINVTDVGDQVVTYSVTDAGGNANSATRTVTVQDTTDPVITLNQGTSYTHNLNTVWVDPGYDAQDTLDGNLTSSVSITGTVDVASTGAYTLNYTVSDTAGNQVSVNRTVNVAPMGPWTFTNAGATGRFGPTQAQIDTSYAGTSLEGAVTINSTHQGIQEWTVPASGTYRIEARGARGGSSSKYDYFGKGAKIVGNFQLLTGTVINILVGQMPSPLKNGSTLNGTGGNGGGGGGGSFVVKSSNTPLTVAGGGGGSPTSSDATNFLIDAIITNDGPNYVAKGRINAGGAGGSFSSHNTSEPNFGKSFIAGGIGGLGLNTDGNTVGSHGGFGGGGGHGASNSYGSGGGGYSGGSETYPDGVYLGGNQGGGGSYNSGTNQDNQAGVNEGHGKVIITYIGN